MDEHVTEFVSVSIAWTPNQGRRYLVRLGRPCTAPGRAKSSTSTISYVGASGPLGDDGLDEDGGYRYILMIDDMSKLGVA